VRRGKLFEKILAFYDSTSPVVSGTGPRKINPIEADTQYKRKAGLAK